MGRTWEDFPGLNPSYEEGWYVREVQKVILPTLEKSTFRGTWKEVRTKREECVRMKSLEKILPKIEVGTSRTTKDGNQPSLYVCP